MGSGIDHETKFPLHVCCVCLQQTLLSCCLSSVGCVDMSKKILQLSPFNRIFLVIVIICRNQVLSLVQKMCA